MALLPLGSMKQSVKKVALGVRADPVQFIQTGEPMTEIATGFLYAYRGKPTLASKNDKEVGHRLWLVTCKHVVQPLIATGETEIMVRLNKSDGTGMQTFKRTARHHDDGPKPGITIHDTQRM